MSQELSEFVYRLVSVTQPSVYPNEKSKRDGSISSTAPEKSVQVTLKNVFTSNILSLCTSSGF